MSSVLDTPVDPLSDVFAALANPIRRDIVDRLRHGTLSVGDLAGSYEISGPAVSQHLAVLERAGLIERTTRRQWRDCSLTDDGLDAAAAWIAHHRADWNDRFDRLERHLAARRQNDDTP